MNTASTEPSPARNKNSLLRRWISDRVRRLLNYNRAFIRVQFDDKISSLKTLICKAGSQAFQWA